MLLRGNTAAAAARRRRRTGGGELLEVKEHKVGLRSI
jgi:hypothetical protein